MDATGPAWPSRPFGDKQVSSPRWPSEVQVSILNLYPPASRADSGPIEVGAPVSSLAIFWMALMMFIRLRSLVLVATKTLTTST